MQVHEILKDYRGKLQELFSVAKPLLIYESQLLDDFTVQFSEFQELAVSEKSEIIERGKFIASLMLSGDEEEELNLHMELITQQPDLLKKKIGDSAPFFGKMLYPGSPYDEMSKVLAVHEYQELKRSWWALQYYKFQLFEKYLDKRISPGSYGTHQANREWIVKKFREELDVCSSKRMAAMETIRAYKHRFGMSISLATILRLDSST